MGTSKKNKIGERMKSHYRTYIHSVTPSSVTDWVYVSVAILLKGFTFSISSVKSLLSINSGMQILILSYFDYHCGHPTNESIVQRENNKYFLYILWNFINLIWMFTRPVVFLIPSWCVRVFNYFKSIIIKDLKILL